MTCYLGTGQTCHTCLIWHHKVSTPTPGVLIYLKTLLLFSQPNFHLIPDFDETLLQCEVQLAAILTSEQ